MNVVLEIIFSEVEKGLFIVPVFENPGCIFAKLNRANGNSQVVPVNSILRMRRE